MNDLLSYDAFMCFESDNLVSIGTLGAKPKSKVINDFLDAYKNRSFKNKDQSLDLTPNLSIVTRILDEKYGLAHSGQRQILPENILVLPMESFIAKDYYTGWIMEDESTYAIHHYTATWLDERRKQYSVTHRKYVLQYLKIAKEIVVKLASIRATAEIYGISEAMKKIINKMLRNGGRIGNTPTVCCLCRENACHLGITRWQHDSEENSLLLVWRKSFDRRGEEVHRFMEDILPGL